MTGLRETRGGKVADQIEQQLAAGLGDQQLGPGLPTLGFAPAPGAAYWPTGRATTIEATDSLGCCAAEATNVRALAVASAIAVS